MAILFDTVNKLIMLIGVTEIKCQDLVNAIRTFEARVDGIDDNQIAKATGKEGLGGTRQVGITLELLNDWRIQFEAQGSPTVCKITDGNLVPSYQGTKVPIKQETNVNVIVELDTSAGLVGAEEAKDWLDAEKEQIRDALGVDGTKAGALGGQLQDVKTETDKVPDVKTETDKIQDVKDVADIIASDVLDILSDTDFIKEIEGGKWEIAGNEMIFYKDDNVTEIARFTIARDAEGNPIIRTRQ